MPENDWDNFSKMWPSYKCHGFRHMFWGRSCSPKLQHWLSCWHTGSLWGCQWTPIGVTNVRLWTQGYEEVAGFRLHAALPHYLYSSHEQLRVPFQPDPWWDASLCLIHWTMNQEVCLQPLRAVPHHDIMSCHSALPWYNSPTLILKNTFTLTIAKLFYMKIW